MTAIPQQKKEVTTRTMTIAASREAEARRFAAILGIAV